MSSVPESFVCDMCKEEYEVEGDIADAMCEAEKQYPGIWDGKWGPIDKICKSCHDQLERGRRG